MALARATTPISALTGLPPGPYGAWHEKPVM